jgi:hypothetical protein
VYVAGVPRHLQLRNRARRIVLSAVAVVAALSIGVAVITQRDPPYAPSPLGKPTLDDVVEANAVHVRAVEAPFEEALPLPSGASVGSVVITEREVLFQGEPVRRNEPFQDATRWTASASKPLEHAIQEWRSRATDAGYDSLSILIVSDERAPPHILRSVQTTLWHVGVEVVAVRRVADPGDPWTRPGHPRPRLVAVRTNDVNFRVECAHSLGPRDAGGEYEPAATWDTGGQPEWWCTRDRYARHITIRECANLHIITMSAIDTGRSLYYGRTGQSMGTQEFSSFGSGPICLGELPVTARDCKTVRTLDCEAQRRAWLDGGSTPYPLSKREIELRRPADERQARMQKQMLENLHLGSPIHDE